MPLTPELWQRVKRIASEALDRTESERPAYVAAACEGDGALWHEVDSLLRSTERAADSLEFRAHPVSLAAAGTLIGPYRVVRQLGSGGMGDVYLAERADEHFQQRLAIKIVRGGFGSPFLLQRFFEERQILASLEHPNIARLLDGGATDTGVPFVAMEYIDGEPIDVFCEKRRLGVRERLAIFRDVCAAVHYAHQRLVIHRDIKSANILVTADGTPKLLDFGVAKLLDPSLPPAQQPATIIRAMTLESASPEQLRGEPVTIAADVYALGVLLFRLLTDQSPYGSTPASETELMRAVCERQPERPSAADRDLAHNANRRIASDLDLIVLKALRKEPERRYGSVEQFSEDIRRYVAGRPVLAVPDSAGYRAHKFVRRHAVAVAAVAAVAIALCAGVAATLWQARVAARERARAEREFNAVRTLANSVLGELYDAVAGLNGSIRAREILLNRGTAYLDALRSEAGGNLELGREVARGYQRLAQIQGLNGMENLGNEAAARSSYQKAESLLTRINAASQDAGDRRALAAVVLRLAALERDRSKRPPYLDRARALIESLPANARGDPLTQTTEVMLWQAIGNQQVAAADYAGARTSYTNEVHAAEATLRSTPHDLNSSRNLSLACKQLGAVLEMLNAPDQALPLYQKAVALDRARVGRDPAAATWRLDLSFALGAIGSLLSARGDLDGALESYVQAVDLRRAVVAAEPDDVFATSSLVRGYERLAGLTGRMGRVSDSIAWERHRLELLRARAAAHPESDAASREYAAALTDALSYLLTLLEAPMPTAAIRRAAVPQLRQMLESLEAVAARWPRDHRPAQDPAPADVVDTLARRLRAVSSR